MRLGSGEVFAQLLKEAGISKAQAGEILGYEYGDIHRMVSGKKSLDVWELVGFRQKLKLPTEDLLSLFLDVEESVGYSSYNRIRLFFRMKNHKQAKAEFEQLQQTKLGKSRFIKQFMAYASIKFDEVATPEDTILKIYEALNITFKDGFKEAEVAQYHLNYTEVSLVISLAACYRRLKNYDQAIALHHAMLDNQNIFKASETDKGYLYPTLYYNLSNLYGLCEQYVNAYDYCQKAQEACQRYQNFQLLPEIVRNRAISSKNRGDSQRVYRQIYRDAHTIACYHGQWDYAKTLKENAERLVCIKSQEF